MYQIQWENSIQLKELSLCVCTGTQLWWEPSIVNKLRISNIKKKKWKEKAPSACIVFSHALVLMLFCYHKVLFLFFKIFYTNVFNSRLYFSVWDSRVFPKLVLLVGHWYLWFGFHLMSVLGFKAKVNPSLACFIDAVQWIPQIHI